MTWITKKQLRELKGWTDRQVQYAYENGLIKDNEKDYSDRRFWIDDGVPEQEQINLKEEHLRVKIAREKQMLILDRLDLLERFTEIMQGEFFFPLVSQLADIIRQHCNDEGLNKWNQVASAMSKEKLKELLKSLEKIVME